MIILHQAMNLELLEQIMSYLLSSSVVVDFRHGAKGRPEFVHGWSGRVGLTRQRTFYNTHKERGPEFNNTEITEMTLLHQLRLKVICEKNHKTAELNSIIRVKRL